MLDKNNKGGTAKGTLVHCWWECKSMQPLWRTVWRGLKKIKLELLRSSNSTSDYAFEENKH